MAEWKEALESRDKLVALQNELDVASKMQQSILPTSFPETSEYEVYGNMAPARNVGGDFFDLIQLDNGRIGLAVADVSDKGVPAALFMMSSRTLLKGTAIGMGDPGSVLSEVNSLLSEDNETMMFVTLVYADYDPETGNLTYANGGHCNPLVVRDGRQFLRVALDRRRCFGRDARLGIPAGQLYSQPRRNHGSLHRRRFRGHERPGRGVRGRAVATTLRRAASRQRPSGQRGSLAGGRGIRRGYSAV